MGTETEPREWKLRANHLDPERAELIQKLRSETGLSALTVRVCTARGLNDAQAIRDFLAPKIDLLKDPFTIRDMDRAVRRISAARAAKEQVRIFGDYDVDGTSGASLLTWIFRDFGVNASARQPDRFKDGYGLNVRAVEEAAHDGARVLLTVDCGITSFDAAEKAAALGIDLIVLDHHQIDPARGLPRAHSVVNPQRADCTSGLRELCGCGLAFYFARALRSHGRAEKWWPEGQEPNLKQHLDLVVIATAADMVPLTGDNHVLVRHGMEVLRNTRKPGVRALMEAAGIGSRSVSPGHLGFVLGPRINASGRMGSASRALGLLTTEDPLAAAEAASELERVNRERADVQNRIWDEVRKKVDKGIAAGRFQNSVVVADPGWHEGVVGIVASRVVETYRRPAAVIALREDFGKGSVRSYSGKDVLSGLRASAEHLLGFGGHKHAAGLTVAPEKLDAFVDAFDRAMAEMAAEKSLGSLLIEGQCVLGDLDRRTLEELEQLGPFGPGNPEPVFSLRARVRTRQVLKGRHLKLSLGLASAPRESIEAIWFHAAENEALLSDEWMKTESQFAGVPELNRYNGRVTPTFRIRDWQPISE